ncbi:MAG TPA: AGE family epimerase/isomerase [Bryobacteraceae bacterium]|nr:AGE family epimerase/isomerase [Bryobacteraceae bacterium]
MIVRAVLLCGLALSAGAQPPDPAAYIPRLRRNLDNIVRFWYPNTLDRANGGYIINHDAKGTPNPAGSKGIVTQARQVWLFSRLAREGYRRGEMLEAAQHGFRFLRDRMWDQRYGGFYWEVDATGAKSIRPKKHMYGQSFGLYAVSEYYLASKDKAALDLANDIFRRWEARAHDKQYGGYLEYFNQDWTPPPPGEQGYLGAGPELKLMNTHLHLLEAMATWVRASGSPVARERLRELIDIESNSVVRKRLVACTDRYERNWTPRLQGREARVSYGHDLENIWLLMDAVAALGGSPWPFMDLFRDLFAYSLKYGYDEQNGGFWYTGDFSRPADDRQKSWWVQAEAAVSALYMYRLTPEAQYWNVFAKTYDFIDKYQTDWDVGEWHPNVTADLKQGGGKANIWKAGYHNGRAMIECLAILRELSAPGGQRSGTGP